MRAPVLGLAFFLTTAAAAFAADSMPGCAALVAPLQKDPSSILEEEPLIGVDYIVQDWKSAKDVRICTGVARYRSISTHITWAAKWLDEKHSGISINAHRTTDDEAASRARSLRIRNHPSGDGTFSMRAFPAYCTDPDFARHAVEELNFGISVNNTFYREPDYTIFDIHNNGYDTGIMASCLATVGNAKVKGDIFLGTNWVLGQNGRRFEFYVLPAGPQDFRLENRLWELSAE